MSLILKAMSLEALEKLANEVHEAWMFDVEVGAPTAQANHDHLVLLETIIREKIEETYDADVGAVDPKQAELDAAVHDWNIRNADWIAGR